MDNASPHVSNFSIKNLYELNVKIHFNPPYTPAFTPIELIFGFLK